MPSQLPLVNLTVDVSMRVTAVKHLLPVMWEENSEYLGSWCDPPIFQERTACKLTVSVNTTFEQIMYGAIAHFRREDTTETRFEPQ